MNGSKSEMASGSLAPLADRMRPRNISEFIGQTHLLGVGCPLRQAIERGQLHSMTLWGPPGTGKTSLARLLANHISADFVAISAMFSGVKEIRSVLERAALQKKQFHQDTVLFVDEAHRFNKSQQDAFLPCIEDGTIVFVGATTENPSFELNNALLSRLRIYVLKSLDADTLKNILASALADPDRGLGAAGVSMSEAQLSLIAEYADGDARRALNLLEIACQLAEAGTVSDTTLHEALAGGAARRFDKQGDVFYDQISALHKAVRGSKPNAALYWLARMIDGGCDPLYIARRVVRMASEDIGNADPRSLRIALDAWETQEKLGSPEGELAIAQAIVYLACAAKSNAVYVAWKSALKDVRTHGSHDVPAHLRNAPNRLMKDLGHGAAYRYAHDEEHAYAAGANYFPDGMDERDYYHPVPRGLEIRISEKLAQLRQWDQEWHKKQGKQ
ncbi:MAG: replication-associated recombination protein A [Candidatus Eutrophobiaceae bacterium]